MLAAGRAAPGEREPGAAARPPKRLLAARPPGPPPRIAGFTTDEAEGAAIVERIRALVADGIAHGSMAILVRTNAQLPALEDALGAAGIPFHVRGERFFSRPEVRRAVRVATALADREAEEAVSGSLVDRLADAFERQLGVRRDAVPDGEAARERHAAVVTLLELAEDLARREPDADAVAFLGEIERRSAVEAGGAATGVELLTYHRAKGLEWDAVFLPALEEGGLPIRQASEPSELAEERRLLYVGITRARSHLWLSWATSRVAASGREGRRARSRFLDGLVPAGAGRVSARLSGPTVPRRPVPRRSIRRTARRCPMRSVPGARIVRARIRSPRSSSSTTRPSRPSPSAGRRRSRSSGAFPGSAR